MACSTLLQKTFLPILFLILCFSVIPFTATSQWNFFPGQNTVIDAGPGKQASNPSITSDGSGGYFITWMKGHAGTYGTEIYAQHINSAGTKLWASTGVIICNATLNQYWPQIIPDGAGGAIIVWQDNRTGFGNFDVYAQRVNADGTVAWAANGVPVMNSFIDEYGPEVIADGNGGAIIAAWKSTGGGLTTDIYAQRINANGNILWTNSNNGVVICNAVNRQDIPKMVSDGSGGAIISWTDFRNNSTVPDVYAQRVNASGTALWAANGVPVCVMPYDQVGPRLVSDKANGAYIVWQDFRNSTPGNNVTDIYAQRLDANGTALWATNGIAVCTVAGHQVDPSPITDNAGNLLMAWNDERLGKTAIYAQKFSPAGTAQWAANGIPVYVNPNNNTFIVYPFMVPDNNNGFYMFWQDKRNGTQQDIYAQHINAAGALSWNATGVAVATGGTHYLNYPNNQLRNGDVIGDGQGNAIVVWGVDRNNTGEDDIYISLVSDVAPVPVFSGVKDHCRNDASAKGKLLNPPGNAAISITQDGSPLTYNAADSSFGYFTSGVTAAGNHTVIVSYSNFAGAKQEDSVYVVYSPVTPAITIAGINVVIAGQQATFTASIMNGGSTPAYKWQDSTGSAGWTDIPGANTASLSYTPAKTGDKIRAILTSNAACASPVVVTSNVIVMQVNAPPSPVSGIRFYPNPARKPFTIEGLDPAEWLWLRLYASDGRLMMAPVNIQGQSKVVLDVSRFAAGAYVVMLTRTNGGSVYIKMVKVTH